MGHLTQPPSKTRGRLKEVQKDCKSLKSMKTISRQWLLALTVKFAPWTLNKITVYSRPSKTTLVHMPTEMEKNSQSFAHRYVTEARASEMGMQDSIWALWRLLQFLFFPFSYVVGFCFIDQPASFDSLVVFIISCLFVDYVRWFTVCVIK